MSDEAAVPDFEPTEPAEAVLARLPAPIAQAIANLSVPVSVVVGAVQMPLCDLLELSQGAILTLDQQVGEYVDVVVAGRVVARGELVNVDGRLGVRVTEIIGGEASVSE